VPVGVVLADIRRRRLGRHGDVLLQRQQHFRCAEGLEAAPSGIERTCPRVAPGFHQIRAADFNETDISTWLMPSTTRIAFGVLLGDGLGGFGSPMLRNAGSQPWGLAVGVWISAAMAHRHRRGKLPRWNLLRFLRRWHGNFGATDPSLSPQSRAGAAGGLSRVTGSPI
jgi:hypothetical protein